MAGTFDIHAAVEAWSQTLHKEINRDGDRFQKKGVLFLERWDRIKGFKEAKELVEETIK